MADNRKYAQLQTFTLAGSGAVLGATTIVLSSFQSIDGVNLAMTDFGTKGYATLEPSSGEFEESISFTGVTQNANGTATLTGVSNVSFLYPYTETSGLAKSHGGGVTLIITNTSGFYDTFTNKNNDETIAGTWSFTAVPNSTAAPVAGNDLANKTYVDFVASGGTVSQDRVVVAGTAGETLVSGNLIWLDTANGRWWKTDADTATTVQGVILGIAQGAGTAGVAISGGVLIKGLDSTQTGLVAGTTYYASNTAGAIASSAGATSKVIGIANSTTTLYFDPYFFYIPTAAQQAALTTLGVALVTYGENITAGDTLYIKASDQKVYKTDADAPGTSAPFVGFALTTGVTNATNFIQTQGLVTGLSGLTAGTYYWLSGTPGALSSTAGTYAYRVGLAISTTTLRIELSPKMVPKTRFYTNIFGSSTTQFDITNPAGTTFRYTFDGTGTDPSINSTTTPIGTVLVVAAQNFNAANNGTFVVTGVGANFFEVTNASGVVESNVTLGTGSIKYGYQKPDGLKYLEVEVLGGGGSGAADNSGGGGGGSGCWAKGFIPATTLGTTETLTIGSGGSGANSSIGSLVISAGGAAASSQTGGAGGTLSGSAIDGFISTSSAGGNGLSDAGPTPDFASMGCGGSSPYGTGGTARTTATGGASGNMAGGAASGYGSGGGGSVVGTVGAARQGLILITEHF